MDPVANKEKLFAELLEMAWNDIKQVFGVLQCVWHVISTTVRFKSVETVKKVMKCVIILHNMEVEEGLFQASAVEEEFTDGIVIRSGRKSMWKDMVPMTSIKDARDGAGTLAGRFALRTFNDCVYEHDHTKRLLMEHVLYHYGKM